MTGNKITLEDPTTDQNEKKFEYYIDPRLKQKWDAIKNGRLTNLDEDRVYIIDGREGSGKSLFTFQQAYYIDPTIVEDGIDRIVFTSEDFLKQVRETKSTDSHTKAIVFDEAFRGLSSRAALSKINKQIVQALMEMRQNNLVVFIVLPSFFLLDMYPALLRSNALIHIIKRKNSKQRSFKVYNYQQKAKLHRDGVKRGWNYKVQCSLMSRFYGIWPGGEEFMKKYLEKKRRSLIETDKPTDAEDEGTKTNTKYDLAIGSLLTITKNELGWTQEKTGEVLSHLTSGRLPKDQRSLTKIYGRAREKGLVTNYEGRNLLY